MGLNNLFPTNPVPMTQLNKLNTLKDIRTAGHFFLDRLHVVFDFQECDYGVKLSELAYRMCHQLLPVQRMKNLYEGIFFEIMKVYFAGVGIDFGEVGRVHSEEGQLQVESLCLCDDGQVAVWVVGEVLRDSSVFLCVYFNHQIITCQCGTGNQLSYLTSHQVHTYQSHGETQEL